MFKRLYAIGAHEDFSPKTRRTRFSSRFGTASTKAWYRQYHTVVLRVPHRGTESTTPWYSNQSHFYLILRMISCFTVYIEKEQSEGRVDCIVETQKYVYILEFKRDSSALYALDQIEKTGYAREYAADDRTVYKICCNFSPKTGTIDGWKVK